MPTLIVNEARTYPWKHVHRESDASFDLWHNVGSAVHKAVIVYTGIDYVQ